MNTCKEKRCPPLALAIRAMDSGFDAFCEKVRRGEASCDECPCCFCHTSETDFAPDPALAGYIECQEIQFGRLKKESYRFQKEKVEFIDSSTICLVSERETKCATGKGNSKCYLSCAAFQARVKRGKIDPEVLKQLGIDTTKMISPEEAAAEHGVLLSLLNLSPALFKSPLRLIDVWHGEICLYTEHNDFYKGKIKVKRKEKYDKYIGSVLKLPGFLSKKEWSSYYDMKEYFTSCDLHNCDNCWEAKRCGKESGKDKCLIKKKHSGLACWVTPEMCSRNKNERIPWLYKYNCWRCEFYKKPQRMLSFRRLFLN